MDVQSIDAQYQQLQTQAQATIEELKQLAAKLQEAAKGGNQDAREWMLDLKGIALAIQAEQNQVSNLLGALHGFVEAQQHAIMALPPGPASVPASPWAQQPQPQQPPPVPLYPQGNYPPQPYYPQTGYPQQGGIFGSFLNSGFGRAIEMGAGFGLGEDLINKIF